MDMTQRVVHYTSVLEQTEVLQTNDKVSMLRQKLLLAISTNLKPKVS